MKTVSYPKVSTDENSDGDKRGGEEAKLSPIYLKLVYFLPKASTLAMPATSLHRISIQGCPSQVVVELL